MASETTQVEVDDAASPEARPAARILELSRRQFLVAALLLVAIYGIGLSRDLTEPWYGVHDWNGAFFSQLARNFNRYPMSVHHGMPLVAAGAGTPAPEDCSVYATHPPALVWMVAGMFRLFGESEWAARLLPIGFSIGTFLLLLWLVRTAYGDRVAAISGLFYALMPMSVYFGRMVDHEAICLFCMTAAACGWMLVNRSAVDESGGRWRWIGLAMMVGSIGLGVWVDWSAVVFGGLLVGWMGVQVFRGRARRIDGLIVAAGSLAALIGMVCFIVYAGLEGRWADLAAIFVTRAGEHEDIAGAGTSGDWFRHAADNVTWLVLLFAIVGLIVSFANRGSMRLGETSRRVRIAAREGFNLIGLAGVVWLGVFWKQFERHEYWMFFIGPMVAVLAGRSILTGVDMSRRARARFSVVSLVVIAVAAMAIEVNFCRYLFDREHQVEPERIEDWNAVRRMTEPTDRIVLFRDPFRVERWGGYTFRNIVPPHLAWYMDRRLDVAMDFDALSGLAADCAVFVIDARDAEVNRQGLGSILERWPYQNLIGTVVVDFRSPRRRAASPGSEVAH